MAFKHHGPSVRHHESADDDDEDDGDGEKSCGYTYKIRNSREPHLSLFFMVETMRKRMNSCKSSHYTREMRGSSVMKKKKL